MNGFVGNQMDSWVTGEKADNNDFKMASKSEIYSITALNRRVIIFNSKEQNISLTF